MSWPWFTNAVKAAGGNSVRSRARRNSKQGNRAAENLLSSGVHDYGGLVTLDQLRTASMLTPGPLAFPIGIKNGYVVFDNSDMSINVYGPPGSQKTMSLVFPAAATWAGSTLFVDIDHQIIRGCKAYRESLGHKSIVLNPHSLYGFASNHYNIFQPVLKALQRGDLTLAIEIARRQAAILVPDTPKARQGDNSWIDVGAREILAVAIVHLGQERPGECSPGGLFSFLARAPKDVIDEMGHNSSVMFVLRRALKYISEYASGAEKQVFWKFEKAGEPLTLFEPGTPYEATSNRSDFDPAECKSGDRPVDLYLCFDGTQIDSGGPYLTLMLSSIIEDIAGASGSRHTLILADEFSQIPSAQTVLKTIRLYRKRLIKVVTLSQSRQSLADRIGQNLQRDVESMAGTNIFLSPEYAVSGELSAKSGTKTAFARSLNDDDELGERSSKSFSEISKPNLHIADLCFNSEDGEQQSIIECKNLPGLLIGERRGWYEVYPWAEQLSDSYLDDSGRYAPIAPSISLDEAKALFGFDAPFSLSDIHTRARLLEGRFDTHLITAARQLLETTL